MTDAMAQSSPARIGTAAARNEAAAAADGIIQTLRATRAVVAAGGLVCLDGIETEVAQLCVGCLGLERPDQSSLRQLLLALRAELDATMALQTALPETAPCPSTTC